ncbi:anaerobic sulfatase maturase [Alkaliflexus imshenetskii]|uniref:anaerobic sulfatase maturase n=1 Tax=Alkaliflexus imshenetskii TaxID=286730 RepID=UPI00047AE17D|nr:anaerobic sulfatase maturase [Alkaliflexus imshenetskii]
MKPSYKPLNSVLIKPAGPDCNLGCTYCFYLEKAELFKETTVHRMSDEVLEETIRQVMAQSGKEVSITWQGGEPTLMGLEFFEKVIKYEQIYGKGKTVGNGLQTNGLLIDEEWADFLQRYNFLVGLSIDGPQHVHDHYRLTRSGRPSWETVMKSAKLLMQRDVAVNAMCCITNYSAGFAKEIYDFYKTNGFEWMQFIPIVETDKQNPKKAADFSLTDIQYGEFMIEIFDLWLKDFVNGQPTTNVRFIDTIFHTYVGLQAPECTMARECGVYLTIEHNGDIFSCDFFVDPKWKLGSVKNGHLIDMLNSKKQQQFGALKAQLPRKCRTCSWYKHCFAGCTKDRIKDPRDSGLPRFCKSQIMFLEHADPVFKQLAREWLSQQEKIQAGSAPGKSYNAWNDFMQ